MPKKGLITMDHFVQGVLSVEDEVYLSEPDLRLANGETIRILYTDLRPRGEQREEDNPVSKLLEANQWYEMLLIVQIGLGKDKKVTYTPNPPPGTRLELKCREVQVFSEVVKHNDVLQGIILDLNWDATGVPHLAVAGQRVYTHRFVLVQTAIGKMVMSYPALQERLGEQVKTLAPGGYLEWEPSRLDILAIIAKRPLKIKHDSFSLQREYASDGEVETLKEVILMDELLAKASVPADGTVFIGKLIEKPLLSTALNKFIGPRYSLHVRPLAFGVMQEQPPSHSANSRERITGEIVLESSERVPVQIISFEHIIPTPEAQESGFWRPEDEFFSIRDTDLTPEQARQARYFVRPHPPGIVGKLSSENV